MRSVPAERRHESTALAFSLTLIAFASLLAERRPPPVNLDTLRDYRIALACARDSQCIGVGSPASFHGMFHGASWTKLLSVAIRLGASPSAIQIALFGLHALSVAVVFRAARRLCAPAEAFAAASLWFAASRAAVDMPVLWNPSLAPLPIAVAFYGLVRLGDESAWPLLLCGLAGGLATDANLSAVALLFPALAYAMVVSPRPFAAIPLLVGAWCLPIAVISPEMTRTNLTRLAQTGAWFAAGGGGVAVFVLGAALRRTVRCTASVRVARGGQLVVAAAGILPLGFLAHLIGVDPSLRYLTPFLPSASVAAAILWGMTVDAAPWMHGSSVLSRFRSTPWFAPVLIVAAVSPFGANRAEGPPYPTCPRWTLDEFEAVARALERQGWSPRQVRSRVQTPVSIEFATAFAVFATNVAERPRSVRETLQVQLVPASEARAFGPDWSRVSFANATAMFRSFDSIVDRSHLRACFALLPIRVRDSESCVTVAEPFAPSPGDDNPGYLSVPALGAFRHDHVPRGRPYLLTYELSLAMDADGAAHDLQTIDDQCDGVPWMIEAVRDLDFVGTLPSRSIRVTSARPGRGTLVLSKHFDESKHVWDRSWPPDLIETRADEAQVRAVLAGRNCE